MFLALSGTDLVVNVLNVKMRTDTRWFKSENGR